MNRYLSRTVAALAVAGLSFGLVACSGDEAGPADTPGSVVTVPAGGDPSSPAPSSPSADPTSPAPSTSSPSSSTNNNDRDLRTAEVIPWQDAVAAAQEQFDGELTSVTLEWDRGRLVYDIDLESDSQEYDADVDATTGEVLRDETDNDRDDDDDDTFDPADVIDVADAMQTALDRVDGRVTEWQLDKDDRRIEFTFEIRDGDDDVEVTIDATTGELIEIDD